MKCTCSRGLVPVGLALLMIVSAGGARAAGVYSSGLFQLGDGQPPPGFSGAAKIVHTDGQAGLDWSDLFDAGGNALAGVQGAVFIADDVSLGSGFEGSALAGNDLVKNGTASAANDIGNVYAYVTRDADGHAVLFVGIERLSNGDSFVELELDQTLVRFGHGGYGHNVPWKLLGARQEGDAIVRLDFAGGVLAGASFYRYGDGAFGFAAGIGGEGCNDGETFCAITNAGTIDGGPWDSGQIAPERFVEVGVDLSALLGSSPNYRSLRFRTPEDIALGYLGEGK